MGKQILSNPDIYPDENVLALELRESYNVFSTFLASLEDYKINLEWHYYKDVKGWLGKAVTKKKTVFWLSVWEGYFKMNFYFTDKTRTGIADLPVAEEIKEMAANNEEQKKYININFDISNEAQLRDVYTIISYKQSLK